MDDLQEKFGIAEVMTDETSLRILESTLLGTDTHLVHLPKILASDPVAKMLHLRRGHVLVVGASYYYVY